MLIGVFTNRENFEDFNVYDEMPEGYHIIGRVRKGLPKSCSMIYNKETGETDLLITDKKGWVSDYGEIQKTENAQL